MMSAWRKWRLGLLFGGLLVVAVAGLSVSVALTGYAFYPGPSFPPASAGGDGLEQAPTPEPTASVLTPVATMVAPDTSIAEPRQTIVTPEASLALAVGGLSALMALTGYAFYPGPSFAPSDGVPQQTSPGGYT